MDGRSDAISHDHARFGDLDRPLTDEIAHHSAVDFRCFRANPRHEGQIRGLVDKQMLAVEISHHFPRGTEESVPVTIDPAGDLSINPEDLASDLRRRQGGLLMDGQIASYLQRFPPVVPDFHVLQADGGAAAFANDGGDLLAETELRTAIEALGRALEKDRAEG